MPDNEFPIRVSIHFNSRVADELVHYYVQAGSPNGVTSANFIQWLSEGMKEMTYNALSAYVREPHRGTLVTTIGEQDEIENETPI